MRINRYSLLACLATGTLVAGTALGIGTASAASTLAEAGSSGEAVITGEFSDDCLHFEADAEKPDGTPKDISHVVIFYQDGTSEKHEGVNDPHFEWDEEPGDEMSAAEVKSGTTVERFECEGGGTEPPQCDDGDDNDGDGYTDYPNDPQCDSPEDNDEANGTERPQCDDGDDNDGDGYTDYPNDPQCDSPEDNDEANGTEPPSGSFSCRASVLRLEGSQIIGPVLGDPFEPFVANEQKSPCVSDDGSSGLEGEQEFDFGGGSLRALYATTDDTNGADAEAGVAELHLFGPDGSPFLKATVLEATASGRCQGGSPELDGGSTVLTLDLNGNPVVLPPGNEHHEIAVPGIGTLHLNYSDEFATDDGSERVHRALWLDIEMPLQDATGDVIVAEAIADYSGNPCAIS